MVTSVDSDQRNPGPKAEADQIPDQPGPGAAETVAVSSVFEPAVDPTVPAIAADAEPAPEAGPTLVAAIAATGPEAEAAIPTAGNAGVVERADDPTTAAAALTARVSAAEERATSAEAAVAALTERMAALESRAEHADGAARSLTDGIAAADEQLESLTARVAELAAATARDRTGTAAIGTDVAELQESVRRIDQDASIAIAREVERHTTAELVDGQQRLHQAAVAMAGLAQSLADAAREIPPELTADSARTLLDSFAVDVDLLLHQLGHEALGVVAGERFDAKRHRALRRVPTTDPSADRTVARVVRDGYRTPATHRVLLFADVEVFRATAAAPAGQNPTVSTGTSSEKGS